MATNTICDFCGGKADARGSGVLKIATVHGSNGGSWDHCRNCRVPLMELLSTTSFKPEQRPLELVEATGRTVADIQSEIDVLMDLKEQPIGKSRPEIMQRMFDALNKELKETRARISNNQGAYTI